VPWTWPPNTPGRRRDRSRGRRTARRAAGCSAPGPQPTRRLQCGFPGHQPAVEVRAGVRPGDLLGQGGAAAQEVRCVVGEHHPHPAALPSSLTVRQLARRKDPTGPDRLDPHLHGCPSSVPARSACPTDRLRRRLAPSHGAGAVVVRTHAWPGALPTISGVGASLGDQCRHDFDQLVHGAGREMRSRPPTAPRRLSGPDFSRRNPACLRTRRLLRALREADPDFVLLDGTLAECDRVGDSRGDHSRRHRRRGVAGVTRRPGHMPACCDTEAGHSGRRARAGNRRGPPSKRRA
jgi:hypothetical protein